MWTYEKLITWFSNAEFGQAWNQWEIFTHIEFSEAYEENLFIVFHDSIEKGMYSQLILLIEY